MTKWTIVCDSSCDILSIDNIAPDCTFKIAPLKVNFGDTIFVDDETLDRESLIRHVTNSKGASGSACPAPFDWLQYFEQAENVIAITISNNLSGSYNSAMVAKEMFLEKYPDRKIHVVNSRSVCGSMVLLAKKVNKLIAKGLSFDEVVNEIETYNNDMQLVFCLQNYNTLIKNGRMNPLVGAVASALGIRAIAIKSPLGEIKVVSKQRGDNSTYKYMVNLMAEKKNLSNIPIYINHCENEAGANIIKNMLMENYGCKDITILKTRGLCSYYANLGGIIVSY